MTANEELKTVVRNWIAKRIQSTNDDYLASNDYVKFDRIEEEGATSGVYSTVLKDTDTSGQIEFVDTLDDVERQKIIVFLDANEEVVPYPNGHGFSEEFSWSATQEENYRATATRIANGEMDSQLDQAIAGDPTNKDKYEKMKTITHIAVRYKDTPDKNMKIVGMNMFNDAVSTLESSITSSNGNISTLTSRITRLEKRLAALISAFEDDPTYRERVLTWIEILENETPITIREAIELERIYFNILFLASANSDITRLSELGAPDNQIFDQTDNETKALNDLFDELKATYNDIANEQFNTYQARILYNKLVEQYGESQDVPENVDSYMKSWENIAAVETAAIQAFEQQLTDWQTLGEGEVISLRDSVQINIINLAFTNSNISSVPDVYARFISWCSSSLNKLTLDTSDKETKLMIDLYDEIEVANVSGPASYANMSAKFCSLVEQYANNEKPDNVNTYINTWFDMQDNLYFIFVSLDRY